MGLNLKRATGKLWKSVSKPSKPEERVKRSALGAMSRGLHHAAQDSGNRTLVNLTKEMENVNNPRLAAKDIKAYYNPEEPEVATAGPDLEMRRQMEEDAARRRRGMAGRSLLRAGVGTSGAGGKATVG